MKGGEPKIRHQLGKTCGCSTGRGPRAQPGVCGGAERGCWRPCYLPSCSRRARLPLLSFGIVLSCEALPSPASVCGETASQASTLESLQAHRLAKSVSLQGLSSAATHISDHRESSRIRSQTLSRHHRRPAPPTGGHDAENLRPRARGASGLPRPETGTRLRRGRQGTGSDPVDQLSPATASARDAAEVAHKSTPETKSEKSVWVGSGHGPHLSWSP